MHIDHQHTPTVHVACVADRPRCMQPCNLEPPLAPAWQYLTGPLGIASNIDMIACIRIGIAPGKSITAWISAGRPERFRGQQGPEDPSPAGER